MADHTRNLSPNTDLFASLPEEVATLILDVILALASVLRWRQSSKSLLIEILPRMAGAEFFETSHSDFSDAIWHHLSESARKVKISRWIAKLKEDMLLSKFQAVWIVPPRKDRTEDGGWVGLPTMYKRADFWKLFACVRFVAKECDLLSLPLRRRRAEVRTIVANFLKEIEAIPIERQKKSDEVKPAKPTLPCSCACDNCQNCRAKAPASSLTLPSSEPVLSEQIEREKKQIRQIEEDLVSIGQSRLNRGDKLSVVDNKINAVSVAARMRIKAAVARKDDNGDYAADTGARARGRASQEIAVAELREMKRIAEEMGETRHAAKLAEFASVLENWQLFQNRKGVTLDGGQPK